MPFTSTRLTYTLENDLPRLTVEECPRADAIVVLGGFLRQVPGATAAHPEYSDGVERLLRGIDLWKADRADTLVFTRGHIPFLGANIEPEGEVLAEIAQRNGVPAHAIVLTGVVQSTSGEAGEVARLMRERGWRRVILVTTAWHLPRSVEHFSRAGVETVPFPCDWQWDPRRSMTPLDFLPHSSALGDTERALREYYGRLYFALRAVLFGRS
jgi:uncharacterized SAM-binding protein YcdF (DUF218 family)